MNLLALNLQRSSAISTAIYGNFSGPKQQEIVVAKGNVLELLRPDETGKVISICSTPVFSVVRSLLPFRLSGSNKDYVVIGSDSGKISVVEFDTQANDWKVVHCEMFGKTGCRRIVPGQYVAADPKGRAILVAAIEKQKFVYVMNRDASNKLTISSPLEAHKSETILFSVCGVDVGFDNPVFAMIEMEYTEADKDPTGEAAQETEKKLTYYELDLGLNHVVRKWSEPISRTANFLLSVPGGDQWPSGVLICGENWVSYKNQGHVEVRTAIPRRYDIPAERGILITSGTVHKQKDLFFFLLQSEFGDLYKVTFDLAPNNPKVVQNVIVAVFDTIQPCNSLCITKTGLLYAASEFGNHSLFQFQGIDDPSAVRSERTLDEELGDDSQSASKIAPIFKANNKLRNLLLTDETDSLAPITEMLVDDVAGEDMAQIFALCGRGNRSGLRILRHGVSVSEMAVSELPGRPIAVWTVKKNQEDEVDRYIVVSFSNATLVLSIGDTVEEVTDSGFFTTGPTLQVVLLADNALIQVHSGGIRHIRSDGRMSEWKPPNKRSIQLASANSRQVAIALSGGDIIYFELDAAGQLMELGAVDMGKEITALDVGSVPEGRVRSMFLAVGCINDSVQLLSLDPNELFGKGPEFAIQSKPTSLCLVELVRERVDGNSSTSTSATTSLYLHVGLEKGVMLRVAVDPVTGDFSDARQKFLGPRAVKLCRIHLQGQAAVMALTNRAWVMYNFQNRYYQDPISYEMLEYVSNFSSEACPSGLVAVAGNTLRIINIENLGSLFNQTTVPLRYTPRKICRIAQTTQFVVIETDHNEYNEAEKAEMTAKYNAAAGFADSGSSSNGANGSKAMEGVSENDEQDEEETTVIPIKGPVPHTDGKWASLIRILEPLSGVTKGLLELPNNEAAFSVCTVKFTQHSEETFIAVGTVKDLTLHPRRFSGCFIRVYRVFDGVFQLLHVTEVDDVPMVLIAFEGRLLAGVGKSLRLYDLGKKKLLKKCENKSLPTTIVRLQVMADRIFVGDMAESVLYVKYRRSENTLNVFADDTMPRFVTSLCIVDYATVACTDKFGNVFVLRLPDDANDDVADSTNQGNSRMLWDQGLLNGAPNKLELLSHYYLGEAGTTITKCSMKLQGKEVLLVSTVTGAIYAFVPAKSKEEVTFFQHLEMFMRQEYVSLCQRDHLAYRSYFQPVKLTVDADLCERYATLPYNKQKEFADDVDRTPLEVIKKLEEMRDFI